jgi:cation diffusion facilitator CzcD-associated flavoprotein CzcO
MVTTSQNFRVVIIGTGFAGLGMAIKLKQTGMNDFVLLERADEVGGTWRDNSYPGCACDIRSHLYSFSFALNPNWSRAYAPQPEIWQYLRDCTERYGITPYIRWNCPMQAAEWDETAQQWRITTPQGIVTAQFLVLGYGPLSEPVLPNIPGINDFQGTMFHSATWNHQHDLRGEKVAVIGNGASAVQFVPQIQPKVGKLILFQRTAHWVFPRMDKEIPMWKRKLYRRVPLIQRLIRTFIYWRAEYNAIGLVRKPELVKKGEELAKLYLQSQIPDPELRAKLTPKFSLGCKRILISDDYYQSLTKPNVEVVTEKIKQILPHSIITEDGKEYPVDTLICATGFNATENPVAQRVHGRNGKSLAENWGKGGEAYLGTTVSGFPNMFIMIGPNTGLGHNSMVFMIESQISYILDAMRKMKMEQVQAIEVRPDVQTSFNQNLQKQMQGTVWMTGCKSWYLNKEGKNTTLWPGFTFTYRRLTRRFDPTVYNLYPKTADKEALTVK